MARRRKARGRKKPTNPPKKVVPSTAANPRKRKADQGKENEIPPKKTPVLEVVEISDDDEAVSKELPGRGAEGTRRLNSGKPGPGRTTVAPTPANSELSKTKEKLPPLQIKQVLATVLKYIPVSPLKQLRLVNKQWNEEASSVLKGTSSITITSDLTSGRSKADFEDLMKSRAYPDLAHPFKNVNVRCNGTFWTLPSTPRLTLRVLSLVKEPGKGDNQFRLNSILIPHVKELTYLDLANLQLPLNIHSKKGKSEESVMFPLLEKLVCRYWREVLKDESVDSILKIMENSPKLAALRLISQCSRAAARFFQNIPLTRVTKLVFYVNNISAELSNALEACSSLPLLEHLDICTKQRSSDPNSLAFLANFSVSHKLLYLRNFSKEQVNLLFTGSASTYRWLEVLFVNELDLNVKISPKQFPRLKTLSTAQFLCSNDRSSICYTGKGSFSHPGISLLIIRETPRFNHPLDYFLLSKRFPKVEHLKASFSWVRDLLSRIKSCEWFSSLKTMTLSGYERDHLLEVITGYKEPVWKFKKDFKVGTYPFQRAPSLRSFKELTRLDWKVNLASPDPVFTDAAAYIYFALSPHFEKTLIEKEESIKVNAGEFLRKSEKVAGFNCCKDKSKTIVFYINNYKYGYSFNSDKCDCNSTTNQLFSAV